MPVMAASWLKTIFRQIDIYVGGVLQIRDNRVNFRNGFSSSQVPDEFGVPRLTIDTDYGNATPDAVPDTIVSRNGSASSAFGTVAAETHAFVPIKEEERTLPLIWVADPAKWTIDYENSAITNSGGMASDPRHCYAEIDARTLPHQGEIYKIAAYIAPATTHVNLPALQPRIAIRQVDGAGTKSDWGEGQDAQANVADYEEPHWLEVELDPVYEVNREKYSLKLLFKAEEGADALNGVEVTALKIWVRNLYL